MPQDPATPPTATDDGAEARLARGLEMYHRIYGENAVVFEQGQADFFDLMISQLFGEVWTRPGLELPERRMLVMGVLAAQHRFDILQLQLTRALETGEFTPLKVRETVIQLIPYIGYPVSGELYRAGETAIALHEARGD